MKTNENSSAYIWAGITIIVAIIAAGSTIAVSIISNKFGVQPTVQSSGDSVLSSIILAIASVISVIIISIGSIWAVREQNKLSQKTGEKIAQVEAKVDEQPSKAKPAWDLARVTLDAYFNRNLSQITYIFWLSVFVMVVGFIVIAWGVSQAIQSPNTVAPATITVLAGVITEFIGATFVFIYRSTLQQALNYAKTLERINSVGMAMQILDTIPDETKPDDLKNKTKANLVELLVKQAHDTSSIVSDTEKEKP